jgi:hypothetical protein
VVVGEVRGGKHPAGDHGARALRPATQTCSSGGVFDRCEAALGSQSCCGAVLAAMMAWR